MCNDDGKLACNSGEKDICFCCPMVAGFSAGNAHVDFQVVDGTFHNAPDFVKGIPFIGIPLDPGEHAEIQIFVCIGGTAPFCGAAGIIAFANPLSFLVVHHWTSPFDAVGTSLFFCNTKMFHCKGAVIGAGRIAVFIVTDFFEGTFISRIVRDECLGEMKIIQQHPIGFDGIERRIAQKGIRVESGMQGKEIGKHGF